MEGIFDHVIQNKGRFCITREDQLLLYVKGKGEIGKNRVIYTLEMSFTLLNKRNELMISALIECAAESIRGSIVYTALSISTRKAKSLYINVRKI